MTILAPINDSLVRYSINAPPPRARNPILQDDPFLDAQDQKDQFSSNRVNPKSVSKSVILDNIIANTVDPNGKYAHDRIRAIDG